MIKGALIMDGGPAAGRNAARLLLASLVAPLALGGCSDAPLCRYWTDAPIGRGVLDPSAVPMLPYNPYWVTSASAATAATAPQDACAGEPGHPAVAVQK